MDAEKFVVALRGNDPEGARELISAFAQRLLRSAYLLCGNPADAEDLVQDTFLQAMRSADRFRGDSSPYTWLHGILLNISRHYFRDRKRLVGEEEIDRESPACESPQS